MIKAIILDMYGVIVKQTGDDFMPELDCNDNWRAT